MVFSFLFGWASEFYAGLASIIGAYIAGIFVSRSGIKGRGSAYYSNNRRFVEGNITQDLHFTGDSCRGNNIDNTAAAPINL